MRVFQPIRIESTASYTPPPVTGAIHRVSVIVPVYRGERTLGPLVDEIASLNHPGLSPGQNVFQVAEVILVHDGATDRSDVVMENLAQRHPFVRLIWLSRNFGQHPATLAGMACTTSEWVVTMDEDGQQNPLDIGRLLDQALDTGTQLVYGSPANAPPHGLVRNGFSRLTKWLFVHALGNTHVGSFNSFRLVQGEIARSLAAYCGPNVFLDVALSWMVAKSSRCDVVVRRGCDRPSGYTLGKLLQHFLRMILTSGTMPLRFISLLGLLAISLSLFICAYAVWEKVTHQISVQGWTSLIIVISFFSGCILLGLGVIAEYLGATLTMTMGKPLYVVVPRTAGRKAA